MSETLQSIVFGRGNDGGVFCVFYRLLEQIAKVKFTMNKANREIRLISLMHVSVTLQSAPQKHQILTLYHIYSRFKDFILQFTFAAYW